MKNSILQMQYVEVPRDEEEPEATDMTDGNDTEEDTNDDNDDETLTEDEEENPTRKLNDEDDKGVVFALKNILCNLQDNAGIPTSWILLDSHLNIDVFCNAMMLTNVRDAKKNHFCTVRLALHL